MLIILVFLLLKINDLAFFFSPSKIVRGPVQEGSDSAYRQLANLK